jgi:hypothetical protein
MFKDTSKFCDLVFKKIINDKSEIKQNKIRIRVKGANSKIEDPKKSNNTTMMPNKLAAITDLARKSVARSAVAPISGGIKKSINLKIFCSIASYLIIVKYNKLYVGYAEFVNSLNGHSKYTVNILKSCFYG